MWDTGANLGAMIKHNKNILCADFSTNRPWKLMSGGEDLQVIKYAGPPFKKGTRCSKH